MGDLPGPSVAPESRSPRPQRDRRPPREGPSPGRPCRQLERDFLLLAARPVERARTYGESPREEDAHSNSIVALPVQNVEHGPSDFFLDARSDEVPRAGAWLLVGGNVLHLASRVRNLLPRCVL